MVAKCLNLWKMVTNSIGRYGSMAKWQMISRLWNIGLCSIHGRGKSILSLSGNLHFFDTHSYLAYGQFRKSPLTQGLGVRFFFGLLLVSTTCRSSWNPKKPPSRKSMDLSIGLLSSARNYPSLYLWLISSLGFTVWSQRSTSTTPTKLSIASSTCYLKKTTSAVMKQVASYTLPGGSLGWINSAATLLGFPGQMRAWHKHMISLRLSYFV